ncbi:MAG TPA: HAD family acid phosphatase [Dokdonella sp.]
MKSAAAVLVAAALLAGCAGAPRTRTSPPPAAAPAEAFPANDGLNAVVWTELSVEHDLVYREVFRAAGEKLLAGLKRRDWDALPSTERKTPLKKGMKPAVIVDVDETMLDNSPYQARLVLGGREYDEASWAAWCAERRAKPLPGALEFARLAAAHGVTVFYLSNRAQDLNAATLDNLRADGFPVAGDDAFLGLGTVVDGCEQNGAEKGCRRELIGRTHRVLLQLGDQIGDFVDVLTNTPAGRRAAVADHAEWIGERWFVLPNPTYGSWEPALFDNDWTRPASARRQAKLRALQK